MQNRVNEYHSISRVNSSTRVFRIGSRLGCEIASRCDQQVIVIAWFLTCKQVGVHARGHGNQPRSWSCPAAACRCLVEIGDNGVGWQPGYLGFRHGVLAVRLPRRLLLGLRWLWLWL
jgi:hypothetical protein